MELRPLPSLCEGSFVERGDNVLIFGRSGRGKTHVACTIGHELIHRGRRVLCVPTYALVQRLLNTKRELMLEKELAHLDRFDAVILGDIGYVQQDRDELEVLFTFLAQRYVMSARSSSSPATSSSASGTESSKIQ